jgi:hypothetical protein
LTLKVDWVNRMRGGLSFPNGNLICVCTRAWWKTESTADQVQVMIHEMGHKVGMVPDGTGVLPDKPATYYDAKGHVGPHCHEGIPAGQAKYDSRADGNASKCVMYGATNGKTAFCAKNCAPVIKKVDLTAGWPAF